MGALQRIFVENCMYRELRFLIMEHQCRPHKFITTKLFKKLIKTNRSLAFSLHFFHILYIVPISIMKLPKPIQALVAVETVRDIKSIGTYYAYKPFHVIVSYHQMKTDHCRFSITTKPLQNQSFY